MVGGQKSDSSQSPLDFPNFNTDKALANPSGLNSINLFEWKEKFQKFISDSNYRPRLAPKPTPDFLESFAEGDENQQAASKGVSNVIDEALVKEKWPIFIKFLEDQGETIISSHLQFCELKGGGGNYFHLNFEKRFSFELLSDKVQLVSEMASKFYGDAIKFSIRLDKEAVNKNLQIELTDRELFQQLAETNQLVKFLIQEFGVEP